MLGVRPDDNLLRFNFPKFSRSSFVSHMSGSLKDSHENTCTQFHFRPFNSGNVFGDVLRLGNLPFATLTRNTYGGLVRFTDGGCRRVLSRGDAVRLKNSYKTQC